MKPQIDKLPANLNPRQAFLAFSGDASIAFLESFPGFDSLGHYTILGVNPWLSLRVWKDRCLLDGQPYFGDPFTLLAELLKQNHNDPIANLPITGGCIGAIAYDAGFVLNELHLPSRAADGLMASFDFHDNFLIFDHLTGENVQLACGRLKPAMQSLAEVQNRLAAPMLQDEQDRWDIGTLLIPDQADYCSRVERLRQEIRRGEVYIANLTNLFATQADLTGRQLYDRLTDLIPAPFAAFLRQDDLEILSASPERLLKIDQDRQVETRPIKGTRPRGNDKVHDEQLAQELLQSGKDRSELLMITDLERNDLSKICTDDSIRVSTLFGIESFPAVHHLVSVVHGQLRPSVSAVEALLAIFPGGSITGAPKAAAMKIIDNLETDARGFYTGSLGYFSFDGQADFNILIRSAFRQGGKISYGAGGGITWESDPLEEYHEMMLKADAFCQIMKGKVK